MVDGDTLLVVADKDFVNIAERNMIGVNPLYYKMEKAKSEFLTKESLYNGLELAFKGGAIGEISNDITKIWNSDSVTKKEIDNIKRLVVKANQNIDFAKTLWKTTPPQQIENELKAYSRNKTPHFFQFAKGKTEEQCEPINNSTMNRFCANIESKPLRFDVLRPMAEVDYTLMTNGEEVIKDNSINNLYNKLNLKNARLLEKNGLKEQITIYIKEEFEKLGYTETQIVNSLVYYLYHKPTIRKKRMLWLVWGDIIVKNLESNIDPNTKCCVRCGKRVALDTMKNKLCEACNKKHRAELSETRVKVVKCSDCEAEFEVDIANTRTTRCKSCQIAKRKRDDRERKKVGR